MEAKIKNILLALVLGSLLQACSADKLAPHEYAAWVEDPGNGLRSVVAMGAYHFELQMHPAPYMLARENVAEEAREQRLSELSEHLYFELKLASGNGHTPFLHTDVNSQEEYNQRLDYYAFHVARDLKLAIGDDTLTCAYHHFERNYGMAPYSKLLAVFPINPQDLKDDPVFIYQDQMLGTGPVSFAIDQRAIKNIPELKTSQG